MGRLFAIIQIKPAALLRNLFLHSTYAFILLIIACFRGDAQEPPKPASWLQITVPDTVNFGDRFALTIAYVVSDNNQVRIQFHEPGRQLGSMLESLFETGLIIDEKIENIYGHRPEGDNINYTQYVIFKAQVQALRPGLIRVPSFDWEMQRLSPVSGTSGNENLKSEIIIQKSAPMTITVVDPDNYYTDKFSPPLSGDLFVSDSISPGPYKVGQHIDYTIKLSGKSVGLLAALPADHEDISILPRYISYEDSLAQNGNIAFSKVFHLSIIPKHEGVIDLGNVFKWRYLDTLSTMRSTSINTTIQVSGEESHIHVPSHLSTIFLLDISESMQVEDYVPNRLHKGFELIEAYRKTFGGEKLVGFSGSYVDLNQLPLNDSVHDYVKKGTAVGNAILLGSQTFSHEDRIKAIILTGDGDNTAGNLSVMDALEYAKSRGIKIYSIGIGHTGRVPYGKNDDGSQGYVEDTFKDNTLKKVASITGGKYYHIDDYPNLNRLMKVISIEMKK